MSIHMGNQVRIKLIGIYNTEIFLKRLYSCMNINKSALYSYFIRNTSGVLPVPASVR